MNDGRHPDTHSDFWASFDGDPNRMEGLEASWFKRVRDDFFTMSRNGTMLLIVVALLMIAVAALFVKLIRGGIQGTNPKRQAG